MKFGAVPLDQAQGAVLAHSVAVKGERLRKGRVLTARDISALAQVGLQEVIVARLEPGDIGEDVAASGLAQAVLGEGQGLRATAPFTGRVNLIAQNAGVVVLDVPALEALNGTHPMITIATVPPFQQMAPGGMVATIKIISYAVAKQDLDRAIAAVTTGAQEAIALAGPQMKTAILIITEIPGGPADKGRTAIAARLAALNVDLVEVILVRHELSALAAALGAAQADLVLILTGSATSDIDDVAPAALQAAGGELHHFGMPVDPGNLLFLGQMRGKTVIGLPGCARAPALNGADWVLSREICGFRVTSKDIAGMGVGGLLKEIPTRPHPRRQKDR